MLEQALDTMIAPLFYIEPGNELFVPKVSHPGEDAGADIRAYTPGVYDPDFYQDFKAWSDKYGSQLYVDGALFTGGNESDLKDVVDGCGGASYLSPNQTTLISAGFKVILPDLKGRGYPWYNFLPVYKIMSRSGLAHNHGIVVTNSPGIIDKGYQDWVKVSLTNYGSNWHVFTHGSRIAQGLCELVIDQSRAEHTTLASAFKPTSRSTGGFGSTGT